jgi:hypothetical protein
MANIWVYALGTGRAEGQNEQLLGEWVRRTIEELRAHFQVEPQVSEWIPFDSEHKHRDEENYVVMLVPPGNYLATRDYLIAANALALDTSGRVRLLPLIVETNIHEAAAAGIETVTRESASEHRNRRVRSSLMQMAVCRLNPEHWAAPYDELAARLKVELTEWPKRERSRGMRRVSLFFSYSHMDATFRDDLARHLELLRRTGLFEGWYDKQILPGDDWAGEIDAHLCTSDILLLLLSAEFFASEYCSDVEVPFARERHRTKSARVIPVVLKPVTWSGSWLYDLQALPAGALPVSAWPSQDSAFVSVAEGILAVALASKADAVRSESRTAPLSSTRKREVDTAMPREVQIHRSAMLIVLIRKSSSEGLRGLLAADASYGVEPEDVHSKTGSVQFPYVGPKKLGSVDLVAVVRSPDFDPTEQKRPLHLGPDADSQPVIFMVAAKQTGRLRVLVEIYQGDSLLASCPLSTLALEAEVSGTATTLGSAAIAVEETTEEDAGARHIDFERPVPLSIPCFPKGTSPQAIREFSLRQALAINEKTLRMGDFTLAVSMTNLADFLRDLGRMDEAEALYRRALQSREEPLDPYTIRLFLDPLAALLRQTNRLSEAETLMRRSITAEEQRSGPEAWGVGRAVHQLAQLLVEMGKNDDAEVALRRAIAIIAKGSTPPLAVGDYLERILRDYSQVLNSRGMSPEQKLAALHEVLPRFDEFFPGK